jgi:hypothetical protein
LRATNEIDAEDAEDAEVRRGRKRGLPGALDGLVVRKVSARAGAARSPDTPAVAIPTYYIFHDPRIGEARVVFMAWTRRTSGLEAICRPISTLSWRDTNPDQLFR